MTGRSALTVGACTWIYGTRDLAYVAGRLAALGMDGAEVFVDPRQCDPVRLRQVFDEHRLRLFSCTPHNVDLAHPDTDGRAAALDYYYRLVDLAARAGIDTVTCHEYIEPTVHSQPRAPGTKPGARAGFEPQPLRSGPAPTAVLDRLTKSCRQIATGRRRRCHGGLRAAQP